MGDGILMTLSGLIFYKPINFVDFKYISIKRASNLWPRSCRVKQYFSTSWKYQMFNCLSLIPLLIIAFSSSYETGALHVRRLV